MRDFESKIENIGATSAGRLTAADVNSVFQEAETLVTRTGQALDSMSTSQAAEGFFLGATASVFMRATEVSPNIWAIEPFSGESGPVLPPSYDTIFGARILFQAPVSPTGNVIVRLRQSSSAAPLPDRNLKLSDGGDIQASTIPVGGWIEAVYASNSIWNIAPWAEAGLFGVATSIPPQNYIDGFELSPVGGGGSEQMTFGPGECITTLGSVEKVENTADVQGALSTLFLDGGSPAADTWYGVMTGITTGGDVVRGFTASPTVLPTGWRSARRIGWAKTQTGSAVWGEFSQVGDIFMVPPQEARQSIFTGAITGTVTLQNEVTPPEIVALLGYWNVATSTVDEDVLISSQQTGEFTVTQDNGVWRIESLSSTPCAATPLIWQNATRQVRFSTSETGMTDLKVSLHGWVDPRGKDSVL